MQSKQQRVKTLFTSNHEETVSKIVYSCSSFNDDLLISSSTTRTQLVDADRQSSFISIRDSINNEVIKFIQRYVYRDEEVEGIVETRMRQNNEIKTTQVFIPDPNSLMQRIKRANV